LGTSEETVAHPHPLAPVAVEHYEEETREYYNTERPDALNFRVVDPNRDHRFYHVGKRPDGIREIVFDLTQVSTTGLEALDAAYGAPRTDGLVRYRRYLQRASDMPTVHVAAATPQSSESATNSDVDVTRGNHVVYRMDFDAAQREDGLKSVSLALLHGECLDVASDTPSSLFSKKTLHVALECNPDVNKDHVTEIYQDQMHRLLRITVEDQSTLLPKVRTIPNNEPNDDPLYESCKILLMNTLMTVVQQERDLFLHAPRVVEVHQQNRQLERLSVGLFSTLDAVSPAITL